MQIHKARFTSPHFDAEVYVLAMARVELMVPRLANVIQYLNIVGDSSALKAIRAWLSDDRTGGEFDGTASRSDLGYTFTSQKSVGGLHQLVAVSKDPAFFPQYDEVSLWERLRSTDITTPVLRSWVPVLQEVLNKLSRRIHETNLPKAAYIPFTTEHVDQVVSVGLQKGKLKIEEHDSEIVLAECR